MKIVYVSIDLNQCNGTNTNVKSHYNALVKLAGEDNIYIVDLGPGKPFERENYIAYGKYKSKSERIKRTLQGNSFYISNEIIADICQRITLFRADVVFIDESVFGKLTYAIKKNCENVRVLSFYHDIKRMLFPKWIRNRKLDFIPECINCIRNEKINAKYSDANIVLNERDANLFRKYYKKDVDYYLPVCICASKMEGRILPRFDMNRFNLLFVGTKYYPNIFGIRWFCNRVFPKLKDCCELWITGRGTECLNEEFTNKHVHVIGTVDSLSDYYQSADAVIAPIFDGGGMKVKTAEAMSYGKVIIATKESLEGYYDDIDESFKKYIIQCNTPDEFIREIEKLIKTGVNKSNYKVMELYQKKYSYEAAVKYFENILGIVEESL